MALRRAKVNNQVTGIKEIRDILEDILPKEANNLLRATVDGIAGEIRKVSVKNARNRGLQTVSRAIKSKRKKSPPGKPVSQVFVEHGQGARNDAWYWHFHEFGTAPRFSASGKSLGRIPERAFIRPAFQLIMKQLPKIIREQFQKKLTKRIAAVKKRMARDKVKK